VKDEVGTAGTYPITVVIGFGPADTIDGQPSFVLNTNFESVTFQCDGSSGATGNWLVE
jgi:hypothetical protein